MTNGALERSEFTPSTRPGLWAGYYGRTLGSKYAFHVRARNQKKYWPEADWELSGERREIAFAQDPNARADVSPRDLTVALNNAKRAGKLGVPGGAFLINEFGDVLVPSDDRQRVFRVGKWAGPVWLVDPVGDGPPINLYDDAELNPGDPWTRPYVGASYFIEELRDTSFASSRNEKEVLGMNGYLDDTVLPLLRLVRWESRMHFVVTLGGLLLTRITVVAKRGPEVPVYVGRLDLDQWKSAIGAS